MPWEPLLTGELATRARAIVDEIAVALIAREPSAELAVKGDAATASRPRT